MSRQQRLEQLRRQPDVPVLIVGGGVNGIGLYRDLALQGVRAILVEKNDFCSGASAASSHMIHGGLRYLENGEFRLVRESLYERNLLLKNAPHYVRPLPTTVPVFTWFSGMVYAARQFFRLGGTPRGRGALIIKVGLTLYDLFARRERGMPRHRFFSRSESLAFRPKLNPHIVASGLYYDAWISYPERLCIEMLGDAEAAMPESVSLNYACVEGMAGGAVVVRDLLGDETFELRPQILVNATGAWIDFTNEALGRPTRFIGGTKGSHLLLDHPELLEATRGQMILYENADGRVCLFFPFGGRVMVGSTDIPVDNPDQITCTEDEIDYMLQALREVFPTIQVDRSHIVYSFWGVRPLPASDAALPGQISRDHSAPVLSPGGATPFPVYSLVGGKWTTFRAFSEQVADRLLGDLGVERKTRTDHLAIGGGKGYPTTEDARRDWLVRMVHATALTVDRLDLLLGRYGTGAERVARYLAAGRDEPLAHHRGYTRRELLYLAEHEQVARLDDLIQRRASIAMLGEASLPLLQEIAGIIAPVLGWSAAQTRQEVERCADILREHRGLREAGAATAAQPLTALNSTR